MAVERQGPVRAIPIASVKTADIAPFAQQVIDPDTHLVSDGLACYKSIGQAFDQHSSVNHGQKEYARQEVHVNSVESFGALLERAKQGVYHYMSSQHLKRYIDEVSFRWNHRIPEKKKQSNGKEKIVLRPIPFMDMLTSLVSKAMGKQQRRTFNGGLAFLNNPLPICG